jgi:hypothetical protein
MKHICLWPLLKALEHKLNHLFNKILFYISHAINSTILVWDVKKPKDTSLFFSNFRRLRMSRADGAGDLSNFHFIETQSTTTAWTLYQFTVFFAQWTLFSKLHALFCFVFVFYFSFVLIDTFHLGWLIIRWRGSYKSSEWLPWTKLFGKNQQIQQKYTLCQFSVPYKFEAKFCIS